MRPRSDLVFRAMVVWALIGAATSRPAMGQEPSGGGDRPAATLALRSKSFENGGQIPAEFTCSGNDISPALEWDEPPSGTRSFALIMQDPDAPGGVFTHWVIFNLPGTVRNLPQAIAKAAEVPGGGRQGRNDFGTVGYGGPCPPSGIHRYVFQLYALKKALDLQGGAASEEVRRGIKSETLGRGELIGRYGR
jgi:Raf kinase inhibitor-like YbhB/YbcL family protein